VPSHWKRFKIPRGTSVAQYVSDLSARLAQLQRITTSRGAEANKGVWLGGLFQPEAYVTATRQEIAHQKGWSLEQLVLSVDIEEAGGAESFVIEGESDVAKVRQEADKLPGLRFEGAAWKSGRLALNDGQSTVLAPSQITWQKDDAIRKRNQLVNLPVYLNGDRADVLFSVDLETEGLSQAVVAQRGACLTAA
jgi:dynein heavy chain 1